MNLFFSQVMATTAEKQTNFLIYYGEYCIILNKIVDYYWYFHEGPLYKDFFLAHIKKLMLGIEG